MTSRPLGRPKQRSRHALQPDRPIDESTAPSGVDVALQGERVGAIADPDSGPGRGQRADDAAFARVAGSADRQSRIRPAVDRLDRVRQRPQHRDAPFVRHRQPGQIRNEGASEVGPPGNRDSHDRSLGRYPASRTPVVGHEDGDGMDRRGEVEHGIDRPIHDDGIDRDVLDRQAPGSGGGPHALGIGRLDRRLDGFLGRDDGQQVPAGRIEDRQKARVRGDGTSAGTADSVGSARSQPAPMNARAERSRNR